MGLRKKWAARGKQAEVELNTAIVPFRQSRNLVAYFVVEMDASPVYIIHDMYRGRRVG